MTLRQLEYLVTVIDEGSFGRAALALYVSQPTLSSQVRALEDEIGGPLLERLPRGVRPTPTGEAMLPAARAALAAAARARRSARMVLGLEAGELEIATVGAVALGLLPPVLRRWRTRHRARTVRLHEHRDGVTLADAVAQGGPDLGIGPRPPEWTGPIEALGWEEFVVVLPPGDPLRDTEGPIVLAEMARRDWVLFERDHGLGWIIEAICATAGFTPAAAVRTAQISGAPALAAAGLGPALVPLNIVPGPAAPLGATARPAAGTRAVRLHARRLATAGARVPRPHRRAAVAGPPAGRDPRRRDQAVTLRPAEPSCSHAARRGPPCPPRPGAPHARVVRALVADPAVDGQHAVVVGEHVPGRGAREGVLRLGVEVDLDDAVGDRRPPARSGDEPLTRGRRSGSARPGERAPARPGPRRGSPAAADVARCVDAVDVAERRGEQVAPALAGAERLGDPQQILGRRVEPVAVDVRVADAVLLAADHAALDLEHDADRAALVEQPDRPRRFSSSGSVEPSNMCELNSAGSPRPTRSADAASSGRRNASTRSGGQWSVWSATATGSPSASSRPSAASARAPAAASPLGPRGSARRRPSPARSRPSPRRRSRAARR